MRIPVEKLTDESAVQRIHSLYQSTVGSLPSYSLPLWKFKSMVIEPRSTIFVVRNASSDSSEILGFAICILIRSGSETSPSGQHLKGGLSLLIVDPRHRNQGLGSALHEHALDFLGTKVRDSLHLSTPVPERGSIQLGSTFPRFFPGIPEGSEFDDAVKWFEKRGWSFSKDHSIDLYRSVEPNRPVDIGGLADRAKKSGVTFRSPTEDDDEALYALQKRNFDYATGWPDAFPMLIESGHRDDVWCAYASDGTLIGATVAALSPEPGSKEPENGFHASLAFPSVLGKRCGIIACVGIDKDRQNHGAGTAMVATALSNIAVRGGDGCFIDWVHLDGFYEKVGFEQWERAYREASRTV